MEKEYIVKESEKNFVKDTIRNLINDAVKIKLEEENKNLNEEQKLTFMKSGDEGLNKYKYLLPYFDDLTNVHLVNDDIIKFL